MWYVCVTSDNGHGPLQGRDLLGKIVVRSLQSISNQDLPRGYFLFREIATDR
jgi:hypothetical protein